MSDPELPAVPTVRVGALADLPAALLGLGIRPGRPVLALVGGAGGMHAGRIQFVDAVLRSAVIPALEESGAALVDGGTDSGIMRLVGRARSASGAGFPLIGVVAEGTVTPGDGDQKSENLAALEPHHTHVILVPGRSWGDESPWLADVASTIADGEASATLVVNGGEITYEDIYRSFSHDRSVLVLAGSGRTADAVAAAASGSETDARAVHIARCPLTRIVDIGDPDGLARTLLAALGGPSSDG
jgi:hypothetical protein